jgi:hypothetical protein
MTKARDDKRIGLPVPYDPSRLVNTFWDIGVNDENCIWFHQTDGVRHRLIPNSSEGLPALHSDDRKALSFAVPPTQPPVARLQADANGDGHLQFGHATDA